MSRFIVLEVASEREAAMLTEDAACPLVAVLTPHHANHVHARVAGVLDELPEALRGAA